MCTEKSTSTVLELAQVMHIVYINMKGRNDYPNYKNIPM